MWKIFIWLRAAAALVGGIWLVVTFTPLVDWWARLLARGQMEAAMDNPITPHYRAELASVLF